MRKDRIVIKIGGSLLFRKDHRINFQKIEEFCDIIKDQTNYKEPLLVVGGGIIAREYIGFVRNYSGNEALCDLLGIDISRVNAKLLISYLGELAYPLVPATFAELSLAMLSKNIIVMGGLQPGQSTTSVALEVAEFIKASKVLILTNVKGIYDKDPHTFPDAQLLKKITPAQLTDLIIKEASSTQASAGEYRIFDAVSLQILKRSKIEVNVGSGMDLSALKQFWKGNANTIGTIISN
ncbi:MAG: Uridylate kinase [Promethearchaeota archaeon]|nr:MAG: Uridylate kinase [Candidatus Lokiarchaeota archaeon]